MSQRSDEIRRQADRRPIVIEELRAAMLGAAKERDADSLLELERLAHWNDAWDDPVAVPAVAWLPCWGLPGIALLDALLRNGKLGRVSEVIQVLFAVAHGKSPAELPSLRQDAYGAPSFAVSSELASTASRVLRKFMLDQSTNIELRDRLLFALQMVSHAPASPAGEILELMLDARLLLNESLLREYRALLDSAPEREQQLHDFLIQNPVFLDPLAVEIRNKHALGDDFKTDFVIRRFNDEYLLVEIEKSVDQLFTEEGHLTAKVTHAVGQVLDFQTWIAENIAYARTKLPTIGRPEGLVVIGRSSHLDERRKRKLEEENFSRRGHVRIVTFDDLHVRADAVYQNMLRRPIGSHSPAG